MSTTDRARPQEPELPGLPDIQLPGGPPPWYGLDAETLRFLEVHQTRAVAIPGRAWHDLGDCVMVFSAADPNPFFNRIAAVRWPEDPAGFDARLTETMGMFAALGRRPHLWTIPDVSTPLDIAQRLRERGFRDMGGGHDMLLVDLIEEEPEAGLPANAVVHRWNQTPEEEIPARAEAVAAVVGEGFGVPLQRRSSLIIEIGLTMTIPTFHAYVVTIDGVPVATGQRYTFDGASYLSSIATVPRWRGRGLGEIVTRRLALDSVADGTPLVYLGVHADNPGAIRLYQRCGFKILGGVSADLVLK